MTVDICSVSPILRLYTGDSFTYTLSWSEFCMSKVIFPVKGWLPQFRTSAQKNVR